MELHLREVFQNAQEYIEPLEAKIEGQIPLWLNGTLLRSGPGKYDLDDFSMNHWFDGYAALTAVEICDGKVKMRQKYLQSSAYKQALKYNRPLVTEFGTKAYTDPGKSMISRMLAAVPSVDNATDNGNAGLYMLEESVVCGSETCHLHLVNSKDLETLDKVSLFKTLGVMVTSIHPLKDSEGNLYNYAASTTSGCKHHIIKIAPSPIGDAKDALQRATIFATISSNWSLSFSYCHSIGMTENYFIFVEQPLVINVLKLGVTNIKGLALKECFEWLPNEKNRFHLIKKSTGEVIKTKYVSNEAFFFFHHINAYEEENEIVVDIITYSSPEILEKMYLDKMRRNEYSSEDPSKPQRFRIPLLEKLTNVPMDQNLLVEVGSGARAEKVQKDTIMVTPYDLSPPGCELPTINEKFRCRKYKYFYVCGTIDPGYCRCAMAKVDITRKEAKLWRENEEFCYVGEPLFVPNPDGVEEDDGVLLVPVGDIREGKKHFLAFLNASNLSELARAYMDVPGNAAIHGIFIPHKKQ